MAATNVGWFKGCNSGYCNSYKHRRRLCKRKRRKRPPFFAAFLPTGICALPKEGDEALLLPLDGGAVCIATLCPPKAAAGLLNGELRLYSQGGAEITLKNNGDVVINGLTIKPNGTFKESVVTTP
ncbi:MAG: hypothetical protein RR787_00995 [Hydrogenoanaerobacterium sp.]